ncbi:MAG: AraC family transcriptional regulator, partial [Alloacidobacterium sp.]
MPAQSERGSTADLVPGAVQEWLGNSVYQAPEVEISGIKSWGSMTAMRYHRGGGEGTWRGDRHRIILIPDQLPSALVQVEQGHTRQMPLAPPGTLAFYPPGLTVRNVHTAARFVQVLWDTDLYSALLPELGAAASRFEYLYPLQDSLLSQIVTGLAQEIDGGFADRILIESLGTALCIRIAQRFVGHLPLPTSKGLSPERLQRVRDYVEAHLDEDLSLTILADIACLSPYHFSRSFKEAAGVGPQRYVIQRRIERAKILMQRTHQPLALIALEAGFGDQSHFTTIFGREM